MPTILRVIQVKTDSHKVGKAGAVPAPATRGISFKMKLYTVNVRKMG